MTTFDSVPPDTAVLVAVPARVFRYVQTWAPFALHGLALFFYFVFLLVSHDGQHVHSAKALMLLCVLFVLLASFLRRLSPYLISEVGSFRYDRVSSVVTRLLPNTRQSWIIVMTLAALTAGLPLYLYLFTHFTSDNVVVGFAAFGLPHGLGGPLVALCVGLLLCGVVMGVLYGLVLLPLGGRNPFYVAEAQNRVRVWIRLVSWFPLTLLLLALFVCSRLLLCDGPLGRYGALPSANQTCGTGMHFLATVFAWLIISAAYVGLDVGLAYVRLLVGGPVSYYALDPRIDGFFCELLVWTLKATVAMVTFVDPIAADLIVALLFFGLFAFTLFRCTSTVEVLEELMRWSMLIVAATTALSLCLTSRRIPKVASGLAVLLCWLGAVAGTAVLHTRRFGWELFGSGREVTADIIIL
ncbi:hypothetical protein N2W54_001497 [Lotmaria passim]